MVHPCIFGHCMNLLYIFDMNLQYLWVSSGICRKYRVREWMNQCAMRKKTSFVAPLSKVKKDFKQGFQSFSDAYLLITHYYFVSYFYLLWSFHFNHTHFTKFFWSFWVVNPCNKCMAGRPKHFFVVFLLNMSLVVAWHVYEV